MLGLPVGIQADGMRRERDRSGSIDVPADRYWGASTQRALMALPAHNAQIPGRFYRCYGIVKKAAALANGQAGRLPAWKVDAISQAAGDLVAGRLTDHFPLPVWQAGSGSETDANVNEVLANRAIQLLAGVIGSGKPIHPLKDVNLGLCAAGAFMTTMHVALVMELEETLVPRSAALVRTFERIAAPAHARRLSDALGRIDEAEGGLHEVVSDAGPDLNGARFSNNDWQVLAAIIAAESARPFIVPHHPSSADGSLDAIVSAMAAVRGLAVALTDIAEAIRAERSPELAPWPAAPFDAMTMAGLQIAGLDSVVISAAARGNREPRAMRPLVVASALEGIRILGEACESLRRALAHAG